MGNPIDVTDHPVHAGADVSTYYSASAWVETRAEDQLHHVASWPGMHKVAGFPDLHPGKYGPVGAAFLADRVYPQLVGTDIGCGMSLFALDVPLRKLKLNKLLHRIRALEGPMPGAEDQLSAAGLPTGFAHTLGTIGGGNHFCEFQVVETQWTSQGPPQNTVCLLVHSGSRGLGAGVFTGLEARWKHGFAADSEDARTYLVQHDLALRWATLNRAMIATRAAVAARASLTLIADAPHNMVTPHAGLWLHRKGASQADLPLVPLAGSRETHSYLLAPMAGADPAALASLAHGAGRKYDRSSMHGRVRKVKSELSRMARNPFGGWIVCEDRDLMVEEAGAAYKSAADGVADLELHGLARPVASLRPLLTYKRVVGDRRGR